MTSWKVVNLDEIRDLVRKQAEDEGLWFQPVIATEDYLQRALRDLHALILNYTTNDKIDQLQIKRDFEEGCG